MPYIATPIDRMAEEYDVVVVGSGYGGAISASRLARAGFKVCLLERGDERQPGDFPESSLEGMREIQMDTPTRHVGAPNAMFDFRVNPDISVLIGCGLGGTSLINANVAIMPDERVWLDPKWPAAIRADVETRLAAGVAHAREMLRPTPLPDRYAPAKTQAMARSAAHMKVPFFRPPITVSFEDGVNHVGVHQPECNACGNCVSGCNTGAKSNVLMNYLPDANNHGAEIFTGASVRRVERKGDRWLVRFEVADAGLRRFRASSSFVAAKTVILAAGSLGSTEILLRSREAGLTLSDHLGHGFTGNGDVLGFAYNAEVPINGVGVGSSRAGTGPGPCITGLIDLRGADRLEDAMIIEEGVIPSTLAPMLASSMFIAARMLGSDTGAGMQHYAEERLREMKALVPGVSTGAVANTQTFLVMAHDDSCGRITLEEDRARIRWPDCGKQSVFERINAELYRATEALGGTYLMNPLWTERLGKGLITVHPLGGCGMADTAEHGVVDDRGRVFAGRSGDRVHPGLYVADGSIIPRSVGVNPFLTISALAERNAALIAEEHGTKATYDLPSRPRTVAIARRVGVEFSATMHGFATIGDGVPADFKEAAQAGEAAKSRIELTATIVSDDLEEMLRSSRHGAHVYGTVTIPAISPHAIRIANGTFELLAEDPDDPRARQVTYRLPLVSESGKHFHLHGARKVRDDKGLDLWSDATTLEVTIRAGADETGPVIGRGILAIRASDFAAQLRTLKITNAGSLARRLKATADFGRFLAGSLYDTYGGVLARRSALDPDAAPRTLRELHVDPPEVHAVTTRDAVSLRLTRYPGAGAPVLLVHGIGMSGRIFSTDLVETNLVEYLHEAGFDAWVLDHRTSIDLQASEADVTAEQVASLDLPAAIAAVRGATGARDVDVVAHGVGALAVHMALVDGMEGVRSAVCLQMGLHAVTPAMTRLKSGLHLPEMLKAIGQQSLTARVPQAGWRAKVFDAALRMIPVEESCTSAVCRRITFMYGQLFEHERLSRSTHDALHELFGVTSLSVFDELARMVRQGHATRADGTSWLRDLDRLAIPITYIHGAQNRCFLPDSTKATFDALVAANGPERYRRVVVPGYGDIDSLIGKDAVRDVYPQILAHLRPAAAPSRDAGIPSMATRPSQETVES